MHAAREERRLFITAQDIGGHFGRTGTAREQAAGLAGLARHLRTEWPDSTIRAFDIPRGPDAARLISTELLHGGAAEAVGYPDVRHELITEPTHVPDEVCLVLASPDDRTQAMNNETLTCRAAAHGWSTIIPDEEARGHDFRAEVTPVPSSTSPTARSPG